jgi:uncharacterized protein YcgI (DUF1989 family)
MTAKGDRSVSVSMTSLGGEPLNETIVPAGGYAPAFVLRRGQLLSVEDIEGQQAADVTIAAAENPRDWLSCLYTTLLNRTIHVSTGHVLYSKLARPLASVVADTVGVHWFGGGFCSAETNEFRYGLRDTSSCRGNLAASLGEYVPDPLGLELDANASLFMKIDIDGDGNLAIVESPSRAGDHIVFRAETDLVVAVSACPEEHNPCNAYHPTPIRLTTYAAAEPT